MKSIETRDKKDIKDILDSSSVASAEPVWEWNCPHCFALHHDEKYTRHAKYRKCGNCGVGVMVVLP